MFLLSALLLAAATSCPEGGPASKDEPCPALVFFDSGDAEISGDSQLTLEEVLARWKEGRFAAVGLSAHSDLSGPSAANLRMTRARAEAVRTWLTEHGIPAAAVRVQAHGEARPLIPTEDGVREPQNRRVEVQLVR